MTAKKNNGCLMGPNWWIYILCIIIAIVFIFLLIWLSSYWIAVPTNILTNDCLPAGKSILMQFSNDSVACLK